MTDNNQSIENDLPSDFDKPLAVTVRQHFARHQPEPTSFDQLWLAARAEAGQAKMKSSVKRQWLWWPVCAAAAVFMSFIVLYTPFEEPNTPPPILALSDHIEVDNTLFRELISTTTWTAPSDHLLKTQPRLNVWGVPNFNVQPAEELL